VIAIIGLLASVVLVSVGHVRRKAKDAKRVADLDELKKAVEMYYVDNGHYPNVASVTCSANGWSYLKSALVANYIAKLPTDPGSSSYLYCSDLRAASQEYILRARLETVNNVLDSDFDGRFFTDWGGDDPSCSNGNKYYCLAKCEDNAKDGGSCGCGRCSSYSECGNCGTY
jgi:type II secretory pathway pseudopilin PulG